EKPGIRQKLLALMFRVIPKVGPFKALSFKPGTAETEKLFIESVNLTIDGYKKLLADVGSGSLHLEERNFDTGKPTNIGEYRLADEAYVHLLGKVTAGHNPSRVPPDLRENILAFFGKPDPGASKNGVVLRPKTQRQLQLLRTIQPQTVSTG